MPKQDKYTNWQQINWKDVTGKVAMLQDKIVKAAQVENMNLVFKLQRQLINCFEGRALAIRNVVSNDGGKTAGVDSITWDTPDDRFQAIAYLKEIVMKPKGYKSMPLKRIMIPKTNSDELRPLGIPTMNDRAVQAVYHLAVDPVVETISDLNSYGFRKGRSQHDAITQLRNGLDKIHSPQYILEADIAKCFDKINHEFLLEKTPICDKQVLKEWLKSGYIFEGRYHKTTEGTPQGGIISPMLCNVALNGMEPMIREKYPTNKYVKTGTPKVYVIRYADDLVVTGRNTEILMEVKNLISNFLRERGLEFKDSKTRIIDISIGFDFLGFFFIRKPFNHKLNNRTITNQKTVLLIQPSKKAIDKFKAKIKQVITSNKELAAIIRDGNPIIRGWSNYFRTSYHSQAVFISLGHYIWRLMMQWVHHKHPIGSIRELVKKYLAKSGNSKWTWGYLDPASASRFALSKKGSKSPASCSATINKSKEIDNYVTLKNLTEVATYRHPLLKLDKNPYLLENKEYFDKRMIQKTEAKFRSEIYKKYKHVCVNCEISLHNGEFIELHHLIPIKEGGKYTLNNIVPLHRICHQSITHSKTNNEKLINKLNNK